MSDTKPSTFREYYRNIKTESSEEAVWAKDAIVIAVLFFALIAFLTYLLSRQEPDWIAFRATCWVFGVSLLVYAIVIFWRAGWRLFQKQERALLNADRKYEDVIGRPVLAAKFMPVAGGDYLHWFLTLHNSSTFTAVGVHVRDIRNGTRVLRFENPDAIPPSSAPTTLFCYILEDGIRDRNDVNAIFAGQEFYGQSSPSLKLEVVYSNLESKADQRSWVLSFYFSYDRLEGRLHMGHQAIEAI
jgi:hypothetical protein